jgi:Zn-dependent peptidase ImmA (M78 family)
LELNYLPAQNSPNIPLTSLHFIDKAIAWFSEVLLLSDKDWPLDCVQLIERIKTTQCINFGYGLFDLPIKYDAVSVYVNAHQVYLMQINRNKINYPFACSSDRRLNFTLAHELGHMVLGHLLVPRNIKSGSDVYLEEQEADEFAGRLLMPASIVFSCNFFSLEKVAAYFNVSKSALWTRLHNMQRLPF